MMKSKVLLGILILAIAAVVFISGCVQKEWSELSPEERAQLSPEEQAIAISDELPGAKLIAESVNSMQRADQCTFDKFYNGLKKIYEVDGTPPPEITESQRAQVEEMIQQMGALVKRCQVTLSKSAEKESENVYIVHYKFGTISDPECGILSEEDIKISVDLSTEKAGLVGGRQDGGQDMEKYEEAIAMMGDCKGIMMIGSTAQVGQVSTAQELPTTQETITQGGQEPNTQTVQEPSTLPLTDATSGPESIPRYPESVMLTHSAMIDAQGAYTMIAYGTTADIGTVNSWYNNMQEVAGWETTMEYTEGTIKSIVYNRDDTQETVTITLALEDGYTGITVTYTKTE